MLLLPLLGVSLLYSLFEMCNSLTRPHSSSSVDIAFCMVWSWCEVAREEMIQAVARIIVNQFLCSIMPRSAIYDGIPL